MLDWDDLRHFLAIARHGTLSGAARALGVQQSTMGRRLDALEDRTGARLLQKTPSGFVLTPAGEAILASVERIESETLAVERVITGRDIRLEGTVRLTTIEEFAVEVLTPIFAEFRVHYPGITLELLVDQRVLSLTKREADVAIRGNRFTQQDLAVRKLYDVPFGAYASPAYLDRNGVPDFAAGSPGHSAILWLSDTPEFAELAWFTGLVSGASVAMRANSLYMRTAAAEAGLGITCLPELLGENARLVKLETPSVPPARELWMGVHNDIRHTPRIRAVTEFIAAGLAKRRATPRAANLLSAGRISA